MTTQGMDQTREAKNEALPRCRICGGADTTLALEADAPPNIQPRRRRYFSCETCGTLFDELEVPLAYDDTGPPLSDRTPHVKFYLEIGAGIETFGVMIRLLVRAAGVRAATALRVLEIGAGFGFMLAMARSVGWQATGVEPSGMGQVGRAVLGVPIVTQYLEETDIPAGSFDIIVSSEVIEHVRDPHRFVETITRYLAPEGIVLLTTPNGAVLRGGAASEGEWLAGVSPGAHMNMMSPGALDRVLREHGFAHVEVFTQGGTSGHMQIYALATRAASPLPTVDPAAARAEGLKLARDWLRDFVRQREEAGRRDVFYGGALFRIVRDMVCNGQYVDVQPYLKRVEALLQTEGVDDSSLRCFTPRGFDDYVERMPAFIGEYCFYEGIVHLNHLHDFAAATRAFELAERLLRIEREVGTFCRAGWPERAAMHRGLALLRWNKFGEAAAVFEELRARRDRVLPGDRYALYRWSIEAHLEMQDYVTPGQLLAELAAANAEAKDKAVQAKASPEPAFTAAVRELQKRLDTTQNELRALAELYRRDRYALLRVNRAFDLLQPLRRVLSVAQNAISRRIRGRTARPGA